MNQHLPADADADAEAAGRTRPEAYPERVGGREGDALGVITPDREKIGRASCRERV